MCKFKGSCNSPTLSRCLHSNPWKWAAGSTKNHLHLLWKASNHLNHPNPRGFNQNVNFLGQLFWSQLADVKKTHIFDSLITDNIHEVSSYLPINSPANSYWIWSTEVSQVKSGLTFHRWNMKSLVLQGGPGKTETHEVKKIFTKHFLRQFIINPCLI